MRICVVIAFLFVAALGAQDTPALAEAKATDKEIQNLPDIPEARREVAFREMMERIHREPKRYRLALASNLAISAGEFATESTTLQEIADLLVEDVKSNAGDGTDLAVSSLAELAYYRHIRVSLETPLYRAALAKLEDQARTRAHADFVLEDMNGKPWHLHELRGKVVLVNFWATWCPPCQREMAEFQAAYDRFGDQGLVILAVTEEDGATVKRYLVDHPVKFSVLMDTREVTKKQFLVEGFPHSVIYDREGRMVAQLPGPSTKEQLFDVLAQAGLK